MFNEQTILIREICNGIMFISAIMTMSVFIHYVVRTFLTVPLWYKDVAVQAAAAIIIMMTGHAIRSFSSWVEFLYRHAGMDPAFWLNTIHIFLSATFLIVVGKILIVYAFAPYRWRWFITLSATAAAVVIPVILAIVL